MVPSRVGITPLLAVLAIVACGKADETPNLQVLKTDLLVVTAHPDDETMMAAAMARYVDEGKERKGDAARMLFPQAARRTTSCA